MESGPILDLCRSDGLSGKDADDRLRRLATVGLMTPGIAHDVNNMLQSVSGVLQMIDRRIARGSLDELANLTAKGLQAITRATALSRRLIAFTRPNTTAQSRVDINAALRELEPLLRWALGPTIRVDLEVAGSVLGAWCDPRALENAVMNLAVNARDAMPGGGVFSIRTFRAGLSLEFPGLLSGDYVIIAAAETGSGMTSDVVARAFDPFFTTKPPERGSGMGLASVRRFAEASGGLADITSRPNEGTTVRLYLPLVRPAISGP